MPEEDYDSSALQNARKILGNTFGTIAGETNGLGNF